MRRGTTPVLTFEVPFSTENVKNVNIAFEQGGEVVLEKELSDCALQGNKLVVQLTQTDTLALKCSSYVKLQIRALMNDNSAIASDIIEVFVDTILRDGELK